jgi:magnesium-transporting ATPase (P-type)
MRRSAFLFFKGLGLLFAILCGIGTAVLGWYDGADWMNIVTFSIAVTGLILWGWYHFSIRWIDSDLKQNIFSQFSKKEQVEGKDLPEEEHEENFFFRNIRDHKWKTLVFLLLILIFIFVSLIAEGFFSGRTLVSFLIFLAFIILMGIIGQYITAQKSVFIGISVLIGLL